jgi:hypothetical protein
MIELFIVLIMVHALTDIALQSVEFIKMRHPDTKCWYYFMSSHALINGLGVYLVTGNICVGCAEVVTHFILDTLKITKRISIHADAIGHVLSKAVWVLVATKVMI